MLAWMVLFLRMNVIVWIWPWLGRLEKGGSVWLVLAATFLVLPANAADSDPASNVLSVADLQQLPFNHESVTRSFRLHGIVRAISGERRMLALQDATGAVLLGLPQLGGDVHVGDRVLVEGKDCPLHRSRFGIRIGAGLEVNNDGLHSAVLKSGGIYLESGFQPIRVGWFNRYKSFALKLEYQGPGAPRQVVPGSVLWRRGEGGSFLPGLDYAGYNGGWWHYRPDFDGLRPVAEGVATNFDLSYRARDDNTGLAFCGFLKIRQAGFYTFFLTSDDGSWLEVGNPKVSCSVEASPKQSLPPPDPFERARTGTSNHPWTQLEGEVVFASKDQGNLQMDVLARGIHVPVTVLDASQLPSTNLLHQRIRVEGICEFSPQGEERKLVDMVVPGARQVQLDLSKKRSLRGGSTNDLLTTVAQVRQLTSAQANQFIPVEITGVVTAIQPSSFALVLQDESGGIYIYCKETLPKNSIQPAVGQLWELTGRTASGLFSPVIYEDSMRFLGNAALPEPIQPTWDQLMNGSLDDQYVEIRGVISGVSRGEITLLTPDGTLTIVANKDSPLPQLQGPAPGDALLTGSLVRIRGCLMTQLNPAQQVIPGNLFLASSRVEVEDAVPDNPFSMPTTRISDLLKFNARASVFHRTKIAGQIVYASRGKYFVQDGRDGIRIFTGESPHSEGYLLRTGDLVEAAGFSKLGRSSPMLLVAQVRKTGHAPLPEPVRIAETNLLEESHGATLVQVNGLLLNNAVHEDECVLELESGGHRFSAVLKSDPRTWTLYAPGSLLQLTGVYTSGDEGHPGGDSDLFQLLLNNAAGIQLLQRPSWWTVRHVVALSSVLAGALGLSFIWINLLRRKVEQRTAQLQKEVETRLQVEQRHAIEQERTRIARDIHDELGAVLTGISLMGDRAQANQSRGGQIQEHLQKISENARLAVQSVDGIVWAMNPQNDTLDNLANYLVQFAENFFRLTSLRCRLDVPVDILPIQLGAEQRHHILLAVKEACNNVVRHSGATEVWLKLELGASSFCITIEDNGRGFRAGSTREGCDGLRNMRERMEGIGGRMELASNPERGTRIKLIGSLNNLHQ